MRRTLFPFFLAAGCNAVGVLIGFALGPPASGAGIAPPDAVTFSVSGVFFHNAAIALTLAAGGVLLGAPTVLILVVSGLPLGIGIRMGIDPLVVLPHAIFEFPAIWAAGTAGLLLPASLLRDLRRHGEPGTVARAILQAVFFTTVSIGLLVIAATIEVIVTPWLAGR
jgi:uncharacterized membrane protein SpoIIM required for sporulation